MRTYHTLSKLLRNLRMGESWENEHQLWLFVWGSLSWDKPDLPVGVCWFGAWSEASWTTWSCILDAMMRPAFEIFWDACFQQPFAEQVHRNRWHYDRSCQEAQGEPAVAGWENQPAVVTCHRNWSLAWKSWELIPMAAFWSKPKTWDVFLEDSAT